MPAVCAYDVGGRAALRRHRDPHRPEQRVGHLERRRLRDVEAVEEPVPDEVEVARHRRARVTGQRPQRVEHLGRVVVGREQLLRRRVLGERARELLELLGAARRHGRRAAHQREQLGRRRGGPRADVREEVADRQHRAGGEAHVLGDHLGVVLGAAPEVGDELVVGERVGVDRLDVAMRGDRGRLGRLVPFAQLLAPELVGPDLLGAREALGDLLVGRGLHLVVPEAVHVGHLETADDHPVVAGEVAGAGPERVGVHLRPVARRRAGEVHRVLVPVPRARRLELQVGRCC